METTAHAASIFVFFVSAVTLSVIAVWARSIAAVRSVRGSKRSPVVFALLGLLVPGLGLHLAGHSKRAAWAFSIVGPLTIALVVLVHWRWLWEVGGAAARPGASGSDLEMALVAAATVLVVTVVSWLVQALDGARCVASDRHHRFSSLMSAVLLVSLGMFAATFRPAPLARNLHATSTELSGEGLRVIPLAMSKVAAKLDPANPFHLAQVAELYDSLGMAEAASLNRGVLEQRMREYLAIARPAREIRAKPPGALIPHEASDRESELLDQWLNSPSPRPTPRIHLPSR
jgi:hypothetical protein